MKLIKIFLVNMKLFNNEFINIIYLINLYVKNILQIKNTKKFFIIHFFFHFLIHLQNKYFLLL
jgi:hypothetical protein